MYPWPRMSAVEGPMSGMEYPMIAKENKNKDVYDLYNVLTHEIGHMCFRMIVASTERAYMWQDEGFNTLHQHVLRSATVRRKATSSPARRKSADWWSGTARPVWISR